MLTTLIVTSFFIKFIEVLLLSGVKFFFAPFLSFHLGFSYLQTILFTSIGGILGVVFFFFLSTTILNIFQKYWTPKKYLFHKKYYKNKSLKNKKKFSYKNKLLVNTKNKYGLWGIAILTPVVLSIPLGTFLAYKYYGNKKIVLLSLFFSVFLWSIIISSAYKFFNINPFYFLH